MGEHPTEAVNSPILGGLQMHTSDPACPSARLGGIRIEVGHRSGAMGYWMLRRTEFTRSHGQATVGFPIIYHGGSYALYHHGQFPAERVKN